MFSNTSISDLLMTIVGLGELVIKLFLFYLIWIIVSWIFRTIFVPLFERRAYFYKYSFDNWYFERFRKVLWFFKLGINKRWAIHKTLIGYVARYNIGDNQDDNANDIYVVGYFGRERVGQAKYIDGVCKIILRKSNAQGDEFNDNEPVGYIDPSGKVFKYYQDRTTLLNGQKLPAPFFVGQCEDPSCNKKRKYDTEGEENDNETLQHITNERNIEWNNNIADHPTLGDTWFSFRENYPKSKKVKTICLKSSGSVPDGRKRLAGLGFWRYLQVFAFPWDFKRLAWGYGCCKEDFNRTPLKEHDNGIRLINRAGAALLLIEKEGFLDYEDEKVRENRKGMAATALLSLCLYYLGFYWIWLTVNSGELFPFLGTMLSRIVGMVLIFFFLWMVVHTFRKIMGDVTPLFERFLEMLNRNTSAIGWMSAIIGVSILGLILSFFIISYPFFALFFCTLVAVTINRIAFKQKKWEIDDPFKKREKGHDHTEEDETIPYEDLEVKAYYWSLDSAIKTIQNQFEIHFSREKIADLRLKNPFRHYPIGGTYSDRVAEMIQDEFNKPEFNSYIRVAKSQIDKIALDENLAYIDKVHLILAFAQPPNMEYEFDHNCKELLMPNRSQIPNDLLEGEEGGFKEYCRFPTESLYDKRGDCDCHAAIAAALLAACGITCCYITGNVNDGSGHAAVGVECTPEFFRFLKSDNSFIDHETGKKFLYVETTGWQSKVGELPDGFENMLNENDRQITVLYPHNWNN